MFSWKLVKTVTRVLSDGNKPPQSYYFYIKSEDLRFHKKNININSASFVPCLITNRRKAAVACIMEVCVVSPHMTKTRKEDFDEEFLLIDCPTTIPQSILHL